MLLVTIGAGHHPFEHTMPLVQAELGAHFLMATETGVSLCPGQQPIAARRIMNKVTG